MNTAATRPAAEHQGKGCAMSRCRFFLSLLLFLLPPSSLILGDDDAELVRAAGVGSDATALLTFFHDRTPAPGELVRLEGLIHQLGDDDFSRREEASRALIRRGPVVRPLLRQARNDPDPEVARRAGLCLEKIDAGPGPELTASAARLLAQQAPRGSAEVLLAYLPFADDSIVADEVRLALATVARPAQEPDLWQQALASPRPLVRAAATFVLGQKGSAEQRALVRARLRDPDPLVCLRAVEGLLEAGERQAVPALFRILSAAPPDVAVQAEDLLISLAGEQAPSVSVLDSTDHGHARCQAAWENWWAQAGATLDLAHRTPRERLLGLTLCVEYNTGRVWECGRDGRPRWELTGLEGPMDAEVLPGGRILLAESRNRVVSERDTHGNILWQHTLSAIPTGCQRLSNGNVFVATVNGVVELSPAGRELSHFELPYGSIAIRKARNGHIFYAAPSELVELDAAGKRLRSLPLPRFMRYVGLEELPDGHFLLASSRVGTVLEVDAVGTVIWSTRVPGACGVSRLPNGHTLVGTNGRVIELDRSGNSVWELSTTGYVRRVHRR